MLNGKQRSFLRGQGNDLDPVIHIGKNGISEELVEQTDKALDDHELIKVRVLENSLFSTRQAADELAEKTNADVIQVIGSVFLLYRRNEEEPVYNLP
ncbi:MAG: ribosome assembly RNA-binding protein YhbY [Halanaerobiales bacterium]